MLDPTLHPMMAAAGMVPIRNASFDHGPRECDLTDLLRGTAARIMQAPAGGGAPSTAAPPPVGRVLLVGGGMAIPLSEAAAAASPPPHLPKLASTKRLPAVGQGGRLLGADSLS
jgi:hypothetical protein